MLTINEIISSPIWSYASFFVLLLIYTRSFRKTDSTPNPKPLYVGERNSPEPSELKIKPVLKPKPIPDKKEPEPNNSKLDRILELSAYNGFNTLKIKKALERRWEYTVDEEFDLDKDLLELLRIKTGQQDVDIEYTNIKQ